MMENTWPALKPCKRQCLEPKVGSVNDRLSDLPSEVLLLIMSFLTMKEAAQTSVLSRTWKHIWQCFPVLVFGAGTSSLVKIRKDAQLLSQERTGFTRWVNSVVEAHCGPAIDELRVIFDLDVDCESFIDKWVAFALAKRVKKLELNLSPLFTRNFPLSDYFTWPLKCRMLSFDIHHNLASLRSLCLKYVNVTTEDILHILHFCHALDNLCVVGGLSSLRSIYLPHSPLQLKRLEVSHCLNMQCIDILVPKLVSFIYYGHPIHLHIRGATLLSRLSIGNGNNQCRFSIINGDYHDVAGFANSTFSTYFSQLEFLRWDLFLKPDYGLGEPKFNLGFKNPPTFSNLKSLQFHIRSKRDASLLGWTSFIEACPALEKLTVQFTGLHQEHCPFEKSKDGYKGRPLKSLSTLRLIGSLGQRVDLEFAYYVVENSPVLKRVVFLDQTRIIRESDKSVMKRINKFIKCLPQGVEFLMRDLRALLKRSK